MKKERQTFFFTILFLACIGIAAYACMPVWRRLNSIAQMKADEATVKGIVTEFGLRLKNVSPLSPTAGRDLDQHYADLVAPELLAKWKSDPSKAPGRHASSSWPENIEIGSIERFGSGAYEMSGKIVTRALREGIEGGEEAGTQALNIVVIRYGDRWLISNVLPQYMPKEDGWKTADADGVTFQYPETLTTRYIFTQEWPPTIQVRSGTYSCKETPALDSLSHITSQRAVEGRVYCVDANNEGGAGSVYSSYIYTTPKNGKLISFRFTLRYPACGNYDVEQNQACTRERETFDLDGVMDRIVQTVTWGAVQPDDSLAGQLAQCLIMSDAASHEKCNALLKQITDFDSCVTAGFSIMKSNPPQCRTPDDRVFTQAK